MSLLLSITYHYFQRQSHTATCATFIPLITSSYEKTTSEGLPQYDQHPCQRRLRQLPRYQKYSSRKQRSRKQSVSQSRSQGRNPNPNQSLQRSPRLNVKQRKGLKRVTFPISLLSLKYKPPKMARLLISLIKNDFTEKNH